MLQNKMSHYSSCCLRCSVYLYISMSYFEIFYGSRRNSSVRPRGELTNLFIYLNVCSLRRGVYYKKKVLCKIIYINKIIFMTEEHARQLTIFQNCKTCELLCGVRLTSIFILSFNRVNK